MDRQKLEGLTREELVALAGELGMARPRSLTVPELIDEIVSRTMANERDKARSRGWLGRARNLLAGVIERGLHLPEVAKALRNAPSTKPWPVAPPPLATMTLAEIYAAQGHLDKALHVIDEILAREPDHADARSFRQRLENQSGTKKQPESQPKREDVLTANVSPPPVEAPQQTVSEVPEQPAVVAPVAETNEAAAAPAESPAPEIADVQAEVAPAAAGAEVVEVAAETVTEVPAVDEPDVTSVQVAAESEAATVGTPTIEDVYDQAYSLEDETSASMDADHASSIEELPLPERYNVDEIVGIAVDPTTAYVYWEVRPLILARAHARLSDGTMIVRLISVTPTWDGPVTELRDVRIDALVGDVYVRGLQPGSHVRISVGWLAHGEYTPFAIGESVTTPRKEPTVAKASTTARWMPEGAPVRVTSGQTAEASLVTALEQAARVRTHVESTREHVASDRDPLARRWPSFDLGSRGLPVEDQRRPLVGGSSDLVRPVQSTSV